MIIDFSNVNGGGGGSGYTLPIASQSTLGGIKVGQNLTIDSGGTLSADAQAVSVATTATTGVVQVGSGLSITSGGVLSTDIDLSDYAEKSDLEDYATVDSLSGYVQTSAMSGYVETSDLEEYVPQYAMALKNTREGEENNSKVVNDNGWLYYIDENKNEEENIFVKVKYDADYVSVDMDIDGQTDTNIVNIGNGDFGFTISIDENGDLFYVNENDENVYYDSEVSEYQYGDFTFTWSDDGKHIDFSQQSNRIEILDFTDNYESWQCVGQDMNIAKEDVLGLVKIGDNIILANDGTISVDASYMRYVETAFPLISGVYIKKYYEGAALCYDGAYGSFAIKYDQMFSTEEGYIELANGGNFVHFRAKYDYVEDAVIVEYASSIDDFEEWTEVIDGDTIEITFGDGGAKAPVGINFYGDVSIDNDLGVIKVSFNARDGWTVADVPIFTSEWTKIADKNGNPLPKSFNGMLYNEEGKLQKGDYYLVTNNNNEQIAVETPYTDIFGIEIDNIYLDADATILQTDYNKEENISKKGTRSAAPYVRIYRDMDNNLIFDVSGTQYAYEYEDGMSVGIDMDGYAMVNGEQQDEIIEGGGMTFLNTSLFRENENVNAKCDSFCIKQYDEANDDYYDLWYNPQIKYNYRGEISFILASENYDSIISNYSSDAELHFEVFSNDEQRISALEKAIEELQNAGGGGEEE